MEVIFFFIIIFGAVSFISFMNLSNGGGSDVLFPISSAVFVVLLVVSLVVKHGVEYKKIPKEQVEVTKTKDKVIILHNNDTKIFDTKTHYGSITDTTQFYTKKEVNAWGNIITGTKKIVPTYEVKNK